MFCEYVYKQCMYYNIAFVVSNLVIFLRPPLMEKFLILFSDTNLSLNDPQLQLHMQLPFEHFFTCVVNYKI
jgi:hypothetical protein